MFIIQSCVFCDLTSDNNSSVCSFCLEDLPWLANACRKCAIPLPNTTSSSEIICKNCIKHPPHFHQTTAAFRYDFPINTVMPKIKLEKQRSHLHWLAVCLSNKIPKATNTPEALIPVPISRQKTLRKGYNQTEQLAKELSKLLKIKVDSSLVSKNRDTTAQAELSAKQRKKNLLNAFDIQANKYKHLAIIDDVMTTGSTANEIAKQLLKSGVIRVDIWVLARTPI